MAIDKSKFIARFVEEARDHLEKVDDSLTALEHGTADGEVVNALFRSIHTIKGSSRMLKLAEINEAANKLEDVLDALRSGALPYTSALGQIIQEAADGLSSQVDAVAETGSAPSANPAILATLEKALTGEVNIEQPPPAPATPQPDSEEIVQEAPAPSKTPTETAEQEVQLKTSDVVRIQRSKLDELIKLMGEVVTGHGRMHERLKDLHHLNLDTDQASEEAMASLQAFMRNFRDDVFSQQLLMDELHAKALIMRMLPLSVVLTPVARMVRDVAKLTGKQATCTTVGSEIELDRQMIDRLSDPMVHLIRNAVDHGLETSEARQAAGKPAVGEITLTARQEQSWVVIEITDDGGGISVEAIKAKALRNALFSQDALDAMSDKQIFNLIFTPGFSTNTIITDLSGRGVGLDVVKRSVVDDMQGFIEVDSVLGQGTTFRLRLPLSLAMMRVLLVKAEQQLFAFTAQHIFTLLEVAETDLIDIGTRRAVRLHNEFIPVFDLAQILALRKGAPSAQQNRFLVIIQLNDEKIAFSVDQLHDELDMVIKPLPDHLQPISLVSGMVMTGSNELVSILHAPVLRDMASGQADRARQSVVQTKGAESARSHTILVVDDSLNTREIERDVLEAHGYQVTLAEDGQDGLEKAKAGKFDAVLTDVEMPRMDGFSLTAALRAAEGYRYKPIIIITSRAKEADRRRGMEVGADAYIVKGDFEQSNLIETLEHLIG